MDKYWTGGHTKFRLLYHLIWIPKYRKRLLGGAIKDRLEELFQECADVNNWRIEELNIQPDHVHLLVQVRPNKSLSNIVRFFKGGSSKVIRKEFPELREFLWGDSFWADGYFAETFGKLNEERIREYVKNQ